MRIIEKHRREVIPGQNRNCAAILYDSMTELHNHLQENGRYKNSQAGNHFAGGISEEQALEMTLTGAPDLVEKSDKYLSQIEDNLAIVSTGKRTYDVIAGGAPNVPAFISGSPLSMRRRDVDKSAYAPLAIVVDITASAIVSQDTFLKRGAAILALTRALAGIRPVELWTACGLDAWGKGAVYQFTRIETAPLDLGRAAFAMCHVGFLRRCMFAVSYADYDFKGHWPFSDHSTAKAAYKGACDAYLSHATEILAIPPLFSTSDSFGDGSENEMEWIREALAEYAPQVIQE